MLLTLIEKGYTPIFSSSIYAQIIFTCERLWLEIASLVFNYKVLAIVINFFQPASTLINICEPQLKLLNLISYKFEVGLLPIFWWSTLQDLTADFFT
jgi:hypothetical protein